MQIVCRFSHFFYAKLAYQLEFSSNYSRSIKPNKQCADIFLKEHRPCVFTNIQTRSMGDIFKCTFFLALTIIGLFVLKKSTLRKLPTTEILSCKNAQAWVSMVSYLEKQMQIEVLKIIIKKEILRAVQKLPAKQHSSQDYFFFRLSTFNLNLFF